MESIRAIDEMTAGGQKCGDSRNRRALNLRAGAPILLGLPIAME
jgi:hypothetical protein